MADGGESLRESEARLRFLGELGEATRDLSDPERVLSVIAERLGRHLHVSRCAYAEVDQDEDGFTIRHDYTRGCASTTGSYQLSLFGRRAAADQREGRTLIVCDVDRELSPADGASMFAAIEVRAIVCCPLLRSGRLVAMMAVHQTEPRLWSKHEVALVEAVVERCWAYIERARALRDLAESEARFRQLADSMPQIVWAARPDGSLDYYNRRWFEYIGLSERAPETATWDRHVHPDDLPRVAQTWTRSLDTGDEYVVEFRLRRSDGAYRWFLVRALPMRDEQARITRWFGTCTDIHDNKEADEALHRSRAQMELVVKGANIGVWYCALPFDRLDWDDTTKEHFHLPPDAEVDIELFYERIHPDDRARTRAAIDESIARKLPYDIDYRTLSADGQQVKWVRAIGRGFYDAHGRPLRFDGITIDVTQRMQAEVALRESEVRFRSMSDSAPVIIWVTRADGRCEYLNRRWYEFTGQTPEQALGFGWLAAVHPDDVARCAQAFRDAAAQRSAFEFEYRLRRHDGAYRWCVDAASARFDANGEFLGHIGSVIDITDRAVAEHERAALLESERAARIEAERASRMKDEFLATLSHELRTPLNAMLGWAHLLKRRISRPEELEKGLAVIERNARAQAQIIDDLLDMSRIISGKVRLDVQQVDLRAIVQSALETAKPGAEAKSISLSAAVAGAPFVSLAGDPNRLHQVLWNLLSNAVKFTGRGGNIEVLLELADSQVKVHVVDDGEGIAPEFLPFAFDRFRQADASITRRHGGLGLGLAIVKQLVELHGGSVRVRSLGLGHGATFTVTLPVQTLVAAPELPLRRTGSPSSPPSAAVSPASAAVELSGLRVLLVDDEPDALFLVERIFSECGAVTATAASAREAFELLTSAPFDLLVSDIGMPGEDGYSLIRRVREREPSAELQLPAIALTAYARSEDRQSALRAGYQLHLAKPVDPAELVAMADGLTRGRSRTAKAR